MCVAVHKPLKIDTLEQCALHKTTFISTAPFLAAKNRALLLAEAEVQVVMGELLMAFCTEDDRVADSSNDKVYRRKASVFLIISAGE